MTPGAIAAWLLVALAAASSDVMGAQRSLGHSLGAPPLAIGRQLQPVWSPISTEARIFLVAGGRDSANFAQEIVDQKKFWLANGYTARQIECFYAVPPAVQEDDAEQFLSLEADLRDCRLASPAIIFAALEQVASSYQQDAFYLYVSSHGTDPPLARPVPAQLRRNPGAAWYVETHAEARANQLSPAHAWFSPYRMEVEGAGDASGWGWLSFGDRVLQARQRPGLDAAGQLFTPKYLARALQKLPASTKKFVVLQACHSGGFLLPADQAPDPEETLVTVPNITVLAAARADRTSFGCDTAEHTTYYGGALQQVLDATPAAGIATRDWRAVHAQVSDKVAALEAEQRIPATQRSLPQYFSNIPEQ